MSFNKNVSDGKGENMNIAPISMSNMSMQKASFKGAEEKKPLVTDDMSDDTIVYYSTWGDNCAFPVTAGQIRARESEMRTVKEQLLRKAANNKAKNEASKESNDEYMKRKTNSTEWMM